MDMSGKRLCACVCSTFVIQAGLGLLLAGCLMLGLYKYASLPVKIVFILAGLVILILGFLLLYWSCRNRGTRQQGPLVSGAYVPPTGGHDGQPEVGMSQMNESNQPFIQQSGGPYSHSKDGGSYEPSAPPPPNYYSVVKE